MTPSLAQLDDHSPARDAALVERARAALPGRVAAFARTYDSIVAEALEARD